MCVSWLLSSESKLRPFNVSDGADKGIIPLTCLELFTRVQDKKAADPNINFTVEVSYIEVSGSFHGMHITYPSFVLLDL